MGDVYANGILVAKEGTNSDPVEVDGYTVSVSEHEPGSYARVNVSRPDVAGVNQLCSPNGRDKDIIGLTVRHERE